MLNPATPDGLPGYLRVLRPLGSGGMGQLYVAEDARTHTRVALKVLRERSPAFSARFEREIAALARLEHPHLVRLLEHGHADDGSPWLTLELLEGEDLAQRLERDGPLPPALALSVLRQVALALEHAHARGVVHRDLKPANLYLCPGGPDGLPWVKVLDFGIARLDGSRSLTGTGAVVGTVAYLSPEQARGEALLDGRTDLWSLGVVLVEALTGSTPFESASPQATLCRVLFEPPTPLDELWPTAPAPLVALCEQLLQKHRARRPADATALLALLAAQGPLVDAAAATVVRPARATNTGSERRLVVLAYLRGAPERALCEAAARAWGATFEPLAGDDAVLLLGHERWEGDEPARALALAQLVAPLSRGVGVCFGRVLDVQGRVAPEGYEHAVALAARGGLQIDEDCAQVAARLHTSAAQRDPRTEALREGTGLVGRTTELGLLREGLARAMDAGAPELSVVLGPVGVGKSSLAAGAVTLALADDAHRPVVLWARCESHRTSEPFAALRAAFEALDPALGALLGALRDELAASREPQAAVDALRASLEAALAACAQGAPVLLVLDDAQWLDGPSREALRWLLARERDSALVLWLFARPEARATLCALHPAPSVLSLGMLERAEATRLAAQLAPSLAPDSREALVDRAGGHPLTLEALVRAPDAGAVDLHSALTAWLDAVPFAGREYLKRVALFGHGASHEAALALGADADALPLLLRAQLVVSPPQRTHESARQVRFRTQPMADVAYALWPRDALAPLHLAAARHLETQRPKPHGALAHHYELGGDLPRAAEAHADAVEQCARAMDTEGARAHALAALGQSDAPELRWRVLRARDEVLQLSPERALQLEGTAALVALSAQRDLPSQLEARWRHGYALRLATRLDEARAEALALARDADAARSDRWAAAALTELAYVRAAEGAGGEAQRWAQAAVERSRSAGDGLLLARALNAQGVGAAGRGERREARAAFEEAASLLAALGDRRRESLAQANAAATLLDLGHPAAAEECFEAALSAATTVGNAATEASAMHNLGVVRRLAGALDEAAARQNEAWQRATRYGYARLQSAILVERVYLALAGDARPDDALLTLLASTFETERSAPMRLSLASAGLRAALARAESAAPWSERIAALAAVSDPFVRVESLAATLLCAPGGHVLRDELAAALRSLALVVSPEPSEGRRAVLTLLRKLVLPEALLEALMAALTGPLAPAG